MSDTPAFDSAQLNLALEQRAAGRDYHEYFIPGSIKLLLATASKTKLDEMAIGNPKMFRYRFGFSATTSVRPKVIDFQTKYDLLDDEIRWLKRAGHLRITRQEFIIDTSRLMPIYGWFQIVLFSLVCATGILQIAGAENAPIWKRDIAQVCLGLTWFCVAGLLIKMFVTPWRTLKQTGIIDSGKILSA